MSNVQNPYQDIIDRYNSTKSNIEILPLQLPPPPAPAEVHISIAPVPQKDSRFANFFRATAVLSFLLFLITTGKVGYNMYQKIQPSEESSLPTATLPQPSATPTPSVPVCSVNDTDYTVGESFAGANNNRCTCNADLNITCVDIVPESTPSGKLSSPSPITCEYNNKKYNIGATYKLNCNTCLCTDTGVAVCTQKACQ